MQSGEMNYLPLAPAFFLILIGIFIIAVVVIELRLLRYAYMRTGISSRALPAVRLADRQLHQHPGA